MGPEVGLRVPHTPEGPPIRGLALRYTFWARRLDLRRATHAVMVLWAHNPNRAAGESTRPLGHRAQKQPLPAPPPMGSYHHQVGVQVRRELHDLFGG